MHPAARTGAGEHWLAFGGGLTCRLFIPAADGRDFLGAKG